MPATPSDLPEVARVARDLIRFDTTNHGGGNAAGEREAAEYVGAYLEDLGLAVDYYEPVPRRTNVHARIRGRNPDRPALVLHGHLDVVPAIAEDWSVDPFAGEIRDGMLWGRGAVDMKDMDAMILTAVADMARAGEQPDRDIVLAFFADEENGGIEGSSLVVRDRPEWFAGATEGISEVGGYSIHVGERRAYLLQVGEKALVWIRLVATGRAAHGSSVHDDNAVTRLGEAVAAELAGTFSVEAICAHLPTIPELREKAEQMFEAGSSLDAIVARAHEILAQAVAAHLGDKAAVRA